MPLFPDWLKSGMGSLLAIAVLGFGLAACEVGAPADPSSTADTITALEALVRECRTHEGIKAYSAEGHGSYGETNNWTGICVDGTPVVVND